MGKRHQLVFEVDKLTNSIENILTGEVLETEVVRLKPDDAHRLKEGDWAFDWSLELQEPRREVFKLTTRENPSVIQGLISIGEEQDHVYMYLLESASFNVGHRKIYAGVAGNLVAFACKTSFERGHQGVVAFESKTRLVEHYEKTLKAQRFSYQGMFIDPKDAFDLVKRYFPDFEI